MCDLLVAMPDATAEGRVLFGKNSDRPAGECQVLHSSRARRGSSSTEIKCSYLSLPDDHDALATLGCRPYWCWGYETGINEAGVVGGNAAIFTRSLHLPEIRAKLGLTGMDLLRLGLERGDSAASVLEAMVALLEEYGQWGSAVRGEDHEKGSYENSFLLADAREAWVLETSGRRWIAARITTGARSISNEPTVRTTWTSASPDLGHFAAERRWRHTQSGELDFARDYGDHAGYSRQVSHIRLQRTRQLLRESLGRLTRTTFMGILRDHYEDTFLEGPQFHPYLPDFHTVCMHDSPSGFTWGNTATSVVIEIDPEGSRPPILWAAYLPPCTSVYSAFLPFSEIPREVRAVGTAGMEVHGAGSAPHDGYIASSLWWRMHRMVEETGKDPLGRRRRVRELFDPLETRHIKDVESLLEESPDGLENRWEALARDHIGELTSAIGRLEREWGLD